MIAYGLVTFASAAGPRAGIAVPDGIIDIAAACGRAAFSSMQALLDVWDAALPQLDALAASGSAERIPQAGLRLLAPVPAPVAIYCVGANYAEHVANMAKATGRDIEADPRGRGMPPWHFLKTGRCVAGPDAEVAISGERLDYEGELAVVIGRKARHVTVATALDHVAGYTIANDLSARDRIYRRNGDPTSPFFFDFVAQKNFDGSCPLGPQLVPASQIANPQDLGIKVWVNGGLRTDANTGMMTYSVAEQIAHLASFITLHPGDIVLTGTAAGVGAETGTFLKVGDRVEIGIDRLGTLTTTIG